MPLPSPRTVFEFDEPRFLERVSQIVDEEFRVKSRSLTRDGLMAELWREWGEVASSYPMEVYGWLSWRPYLWSLTNCTDEELEDELSYFRKWLSHMLPHFAERMKVFFRLKILTIDDRKKHWPSPKLSRDEVIERSANGQSLFFVPVSPKLVTE